MLLPTERIDILCISETHLTPEEVDHVILSGYKISSCYCRNTSTKGGVLVLTKNSIKTSEVRDLVALSQDRIFECAATRGVINNQQFYIISIYT